MKWITLKMNMLPVVFQEIDFVTETYIESLNRIRKYPNESKQTEEQRHNKKEFCKLREQITKRINELEEFYEDNIEDIRVSYFEKARIRWKKLWMYDFDNIVKIENSSNQGNWFTNNYPLTPPEHREREQILEKGKENNKPVNMNKSNQSVERKNNKETKDKSKKGRAGSSEHSYMKPLNRGKKERNQDENHNLGLDDGLRTLNNYNTGNTEKFDWTDLNRCKEIMFKIRWTEAEYKMLMKDKAQRSKGVKVTSSK